MSSNPMRPPGGNYPQPAPDFSRYAGSSFPPPGSNFYPTNPSIILPNPYSGSSIGPYPNVTFPSGSPLSFQPSFPSSSLPGSFPPPGIPSYSQPSPSFNPNPPQGRPSGINPPIVPPSSIPAWVATMQPSPMFNPPSSDYRINNALSMPSFAPQFFSPTLPSFQPMDSFLLPTIGSQAVSLPPSYLGVVQFSPQLPSGRVGLPSTYSSLGNASFLPSRGNSWTPPSSSSRRDTFNSDRAVVQWTPGHLSSYGQKLPSVEKDTQFQFTMLRKFEDTARFMYQMHASPEKPFARWDSMSVAPVAFKLDSQTTLFVNPLVVADFFQRASLTQIQAVQTQLAQLSAPSIENTARIQGVYERVILHINDLPGVGGGQGAGGHVFIEFADRKFAIGNYPGELKLDDSKNINSKTLSIEFFCERAKVEKSLDVMHQIKWTRSHNCVYTAVEGLKAMDFVHAEKIKLSKFLPLPSELRSQMLKLHGHDPLVITYPRERIVIKHSPPVVFDEVKE